MLTRMILARAPFVGLAMFVATGCATYTSTYRAPVDGRARVVWDDHGELVVDAGGLVLTPECGAAIRALTTRDSMPTLAGSIDLPAYANPAPMPVGGEWQPVYYGEPAGSSFSSGGGARPVYFWIPGLSWSGGSGANGYGAIRIASLGRVLTHAAGESGSASGSGSGGGGGGGGGDGRGALIAAVLAAIALPIVDVAVAAAPPISHPRAARVTDIVAAWNDLARTPGSPCEMPGGATPIPSTITAPGSATP